MRVAFITQWFAPEGEGVPLWIAEALRGRGVDVGVVTGVPHYPSGVPADGYRATDWRLDSIKGFRVLRVPEYPSHDTSALRRIATFGSFALSGAVLASRTIGRADVSLVYSSPATSALPSMVARARFGTPYVLLIQDLWPDSIFATGFLNSGPVRRLSETAVDAFVRGSYRVASHICVISPGMRRTLIDRGVPASKVSVVFNWVDEAVLRPAAPTGVMRARLGLGQRAFVMLFAGNAGEAQAMHAWIGAMDRVSDLDDVHLVLLGGGTQRDALLAQATALRVSDRVHFLDAVPAAEVPTLAADADVSVVSLADRPLFEITMPSKVQACLAMASPVIASCAGDVADVVCTSGAGWVARPEDPGSIAAAIRAALYAGKSERQACGLRGRRYYEENMARDIGAARLVEALSRAAASR
jgi:glycosyltransferase involved in cell wall biosynthesis